MLKVLAEGGMPAHLFVPRVSEEIMDAVQRATEEEDEGEGDGFDTRRIPKPERPAFWRLYNASASHNQQWLEEADKLSLREFRDRMLALFESPGLPAPAAPAAPAAPEREGERREDESSSPSSRDSDESATESDSDSSW